MRTLNFTQEELYAFSREPNTPTGIHIRVVSEITLRHRLENLGTRISLALRDITEPIRRTYRSIEERYETFRNNHIRAFRNIEIATRALTILALAALLAMIAIHAINIGSFAFIYTSIDNTLLITAALSFMTHNAIRLYRLLA